VLSFITIVIFSRILGSTPLGTYYPFVALLGIIAIPANIGMNGAVKKRISEGQEKEVYFSTAILIKLILLIPFGIAILLGRQYVNQYLGAQLAVLLVVTLFISEAAKFYLAVLRGELRVGETAIIEVVRPLGWLTVGYALYTQGFGVYALIYGHLVGSLLMVVIGWWKVSIPIVRPTVKHGRSLFDFGRFTMISSVGGYIYSWMDVAILGLFVATGGIVTRGDIGAYENAWRVSLIVALIGEAISTTLTPQFSRWDAENARDRIEEVIPTALLFSMLPAIPAFVGTLIISKDLLRILFGPDFTVAWLALIVLMGHKILMSIHSIINPCLNAINRPDLPAYSATVTVIANLVLNVMLIREFGIVGAAGATAISFSINTAIQTYYLSRFLKIKFPFRGMGWSAVASGVMGVSTYKIHSMLEINTFPKLLGLVILAAIIYGVVLLTYSPIRTKLGATARRVVRS
jgi:O-antigen/teichoic acid export membrane protein